MKLDSIPEDMTIGDAVKKMSAWQWIAAFIALVVLSNLVDCGGSSGQSRLTSDRNVEAMTIGQDAIRQQLKFPTTAKFTEHRYGPINGNEYFYTAMVRAENSLGNKVPMYWTVVLEFDAGSSRVRRVISVTQTQ